MALSRQCGAAMRLVRTRSRKRQAWVHAVSRSCRSARLETAYAAESPQNVQFTGVRHINKIPDTTADKSNGINYRKNEYDVP